MGQLEPIRPTALPDPAVGPRILLISGGSAPNPLCARLIGRTHNTAHLLTPFDSGGSSAVLRRAFRMPAVGDLRSRLLALVDRGRPGSAAVLRLLRFRLAADGPPEALTARLRAIAAWDDRLTRAVPSPAADVLRADLASVVDRLPAAFDARGASLGNLALVGAYLGEARRMGRAVDRLASTIGVRGTVRPVTEADLELVADLENGQRVVGQHRLTGKESPPIASPIRRVHLAAPGSEQPLRPSACPDALDLIGRAELIVYAPGSLYSSLLVNLLPLGLRDAIAASPARKVYVPSTGHDPEALGLGLDGSLARLAETLTDEGHPLRAMLDGVLVDRGRSAYARPNTLDGAATLGVRRCEASLLGPTGGPRLDGGLLATELLRMAVEP